jgi:hypothetical protein
LATQRNPVSKNERKEDGRKEGRKEGKVEGMKNSSLLENIAEYYRMWENIEECCRTWETNVGDH